MSARDILLGPWTLWHYARSPGVAIALAVAMTALVIAACCHAPKPRTEMHHLRRSMFAGVREMCYLIATLALGMAFLCGVVRMAGTARDELTSSVCVVDDYSSQYLCYEQQAGGGTAIMDRSDARHPRLVGTLTAPPAALGINGGGHR